MLEKISQMTIKEKIRFYAAIIGAPLIFIAEIFNLVQNNLTTKQVIGAYITMFVGICVLAPVLYDFFQNNKNA